MGAAGIELRGAEPAEKPESKPSPTQKQAAPTPPPATGNQRPAGTYLIQPLDVLTIRVAGAPQEEPFNGKYFVEPSGEVVLGVHYGRVAIGGLDIAQAEQAIAKHLRSVLQNPEVQITLDAAIWRAHQLEKERVALRERRQALRRQIIDTCGLSPENVATVLQGLERDRFSLEIDLKLKQQNRKILEVLISKAEKSAERKRENDEVSEHLKKIIDARRADLESVRALGAAVTQSDVRKAQVDLAEAEIRLALRREELRKLLADAAIQQRFDQQLSELTMSVPQDEERLAVLNERFKRINSARPLLDEYADITEYELPLVNRTLEKATWVRDGLPASP